VPCKAILHEGDALALDCMSNQHGRNGRGSGDRECLFEGFVAMAVDFLNMPTECTPFVSKRLQGQDSIDPAEALNLVVVDDADEVVEPVVRGEQGRLPGRALVTFAVAEQGDGATGALQPLSMKGDAGSAAQIGSRDLDPASIAENQRFFTAVRRLAVPGASALQTSGNAAVTAVAY